jgi:predicted component of viral defense system (DUF524 family)
MQSVTEAVVHLFDADGHRRASIRILSPPPDGGIPPLVELDRKEALDWGEAQIQLLESAVYEYEITLPRIGTRLRQGVIKRSRFSTDLVEHGRIEPRTYTGLLALVLEDSRGDEVARGEVEVRSSKLDYRSHYRRMLEELASKSTELLLDIRAPSMARLMARGTGDPRTIAQRFAFVRHLTSSSEFRDAVARVLAHPHEVAATQRDERSVRQGLPRGPGVMRQIASAKMRVEVPREHPLRAQLQSIPARVEVLRAVPTLDTAENRFVKFVLQSFEQFLAELEQQLHRSNRAEDARLKREIEAARRELSMTLARAFFRGIGTARLLPLGSSVMQRRSGYREILRAWLRFNAAAMLEWGAGDEVYGAGKRNVAALYEYWLFFQLLDWCNASSVSGILPLLTSWKRPPMGSD